MGHKKLPLHEKCSLVDDHSNVKKLQPAIVDGPQRVKAQLVVPQRPEVRRDPDPAAIPECDPELPASLDAPPNDGRPPVWLEFNSTSLVGLDRTFYLNKTTGETTWDRPTTGRIDGQRRLAARRYHDPDLLRLL